MTVHRAATIHDIGQGKEHFTAIRDVLPAILKIENESEILLPERLLGCDAFGRRIKLSRPILSDFARARVFYQAFLTELQRLRYRQRFLLLIGILRKDKTADRETHPEISS